MSRAKWKGPYVKPENWLTFSNEKKQHFYHIARNSEIMPKFVGLTFKIYNGKEYHEILVTENMVGHKFGEFSLTRAKFIFKKKKSKK